MLIGNLMFLRQAFKGGIEKQVVFKDTSLRCVSVEFSPVFL